ncbi:MAG: hypothetical protein JWO82_3564 [Akkermansiaceae bacterium]|nr:hypothetical protein [Akkermansiaceae bacterium]
MPAKWLTRPVAARKAHGRRPHFQERRRCEMRQPGVRPLVAPPGKAARRARPHAAHPTTFRRGRSSSKALPTSFPRCQGQRPHFLRLLHFALATFTSHQGHSCRSTSTSPTRCCSSKAVKPHPNRRTGKNPAKPHPGFKIHAIRVSPDSLPNTPGQPHPVPATGEGSELRLTLANLTFCHGPTDHSVTREILRLPVSVSPSDISA